MATVGDLADTIHLIRKIINAIETAQKLKDDCLDFKEYLWCISKNLEQLQGMRLSDTTVETLRKVADVLAKAYHVINSSQNHNFVYLMLNGTHILKQIKEAHSMVVDYMALIPIAQLNETFRFFSERTIILGEPRESAPNGTNAVSNSGYLMAQGVCNGQIALSNQAEFKNDLRIFKFKELRNATDDFKHDHLIGHGGAAIVYKGLVKDNSGLGTLDVAIKRFNGNLNRLWFHEAELKHLGRISHPNVIKLLGYCNKINKTRLIGFRRKEANIYLLVFEYMANGSLFDHLFSDKQDFELSWAQRIKIANDSARALTHLHELQIIHRDVKSSNILLDSNFNSKLADFESALDFPTYSTDRVEVCGTIGYIAPEYITYGELSEKIDVYGFGSTLLEILSGQHVHDLKQLLMSQEFQSPEDFSTSREFRSPEDSSTSQEFRRPVDSSTTIYQEFQSPEDSSASQEFRRPVDSSITIYRDSYLQKFIISSTSDLENIDNLMDPRLEGKYPLESARLAIQLALSCVDSDPNKRPSMKEVIKVFEQIQSIKIPLTTSAPSRIISDPCDPLPCDIEFLVSRSMVYEPAHFDADAELSFSVPRSMMMSEPSPYDADAELSLSLSKSMFVYEPAPFDAETELSFPKFKTSHSPISIEV